MQFDGREITVIDGLPDCSSRCSVGKCGKRNWEVAKLASRPTASRETDPTASMVCESHNNNDNKNNNKN